MYLHIGNGETVRKKDIIGIFEMDTATVSAAGRQFLYKKEKEKKVIYTDADIPRSFLILEKRKDHQSEKIYLSKISTAGLKIRLSGVISSVED